MPTAMIEGRHVYFREAGEGEGVVLVHGAGSSGGQWRPLIDRLCGRYRVLAPDLWGHGKSTPLQLGRNNSFRPELLIIEEMLDKIGGRVHLVGHSFGGSLATLTAIQHADRLASLTLIEPTLCDILAEAGEHEADKEIRAVARAAIDGVDAGKLAEAAEGFVDYWIAPGAFTAMPKETQDSIIASMPGVRLIWIRTFANGPPILPQIARIMAPTLLVTGSLTPFAERRVIETVRRVLPNHDYAEIAGAGHLAPVTHPEQVNALVEAHIVKHSARA